MPRFRPLRPEWLTLLVSLFLLIFDNFALWRHLLEVAPPSEGHNALVLAALGLLLAGAFNLLLTPVAVRGLFKPVITALLFIGAGVAYFMNQYGVLIDDSMLRNLWETDSAEAADLFSLTLVGYLLALGALPAWLLWKTPVAYRRWPRELLAKGVSGALTAALMVGVVVLNYQGLSSLLRNHHEIHLQLTPSNAIGALFAYARESLARPQGPLRPIGTDAVRQQPAGGAPRHALTVLVVGESARADNFGLNGYDRDTTPELARIPGLISFTRMQSCGTQTAVSVPCMFSNLTRAGYSDAVAKSQENLLDVLKRAGYEVLWRDNQAGCKETCKRVDFVSLSHDQDPAYCADGECHDAILLRDLQGLIDHLQRDTVLVLHQMGSHGPDYYKRVPAGFEPFTPVCRSNELNQCSQQSIVNAYDNTIRYTDQVLAGLIGVLQANQGKVDTGLFYLADHGESLGEYNIFLHGMPYALAPAQQKHVASLAWFSPGYQRDLGVDSTCLAGQRDTPLSHDNLFHSMLGLLQVRTEVYKPALDLFAHCRRPPSGAMVAGGEPLAPAQPPPGS